MGVLDTLRPVGTFLNTGWTRVGGASDHGVLADDSDATYLHASAPLSGNNLVVTMAGHTVPAGHQRHLILMAVKALAPTGGTINWSGTVTSWNANIAGATASPPSGTPDVLWGPWFVSPAVQFPSTALASGDMRFHIRVPSGTAVRAVEAYVFIDNRARPSFTAEVHDGAGVDRDAGVITDTSRPTFVFDSPDYDSLVARSWTLEVRTVPGGVVVYTASGTGVPPNVQADPLPNGDYEADLQISSTIRTDSAYLSTVENVTFEIAFVQPAGPVLALTPILSPPSIEIDWVSDTATATAWDSNADVVTEIRRTDCNGTQTFYVERTGIGANDFIDRFMSLSYNGVFCDEEDHNCQVCYEARYWGEVDSVLIATDWSTPECDTVANPTVGNAWMRGANSGDISICPTESFDHIRPFGVFQPIAGGIPTVITGTPGGRDYSLDFAVTSEAELVLVESILAQALFFYQPVEQADIWLAPANQNMTVTKVKRIRTINVPCVAVNPQPITDPASLF